jgi:ribonuclease HI
MDDLTFYVDGGMLGDRNPSPEGVYWSVWCAPPGSVVLHEQSTEHHTNNEAEWLALQAALRYALKHHPKASRIMVYSDSQLVVQLFNGRWKASNARMIEMQRETRRLMVDFESCQVRWKPRIEMVRRLGH